MAGYRYNRDLSGIGDFIENEVPSTTQKESPIKEIIQLRSIVTDPSLQKEEEEERKHGVDHIPSRDYNNYQERKEKPTLKSSKRPGSAMGTSHTYNTVKRQTRVEGDVTDYCYDMSKENLALKEKENLLEREITKMMTKLRRIEELARSGRGQMDLDFSKIQGELEDQFNEIKDENTMLKERVRKLKTIHNGMSSTTTKQGGSSTIQKRASSRPKFQASKTVSAKTNKVVPVSSSTSYLPSKTHNNTSGAFTHDKLTEQLRDQLVKNEKELLKLRTEQVRMSQSSQGMYGQEQIMNRLRSYDDELREIRSGMEQVQDQYHNNERIFKESKAYMEEVLKQIREQRINNETLKQKNMRLQIQGGSSKDLSEQLSMLEAERDGLEKSIRHITSEPFFKRENGQSTLKRMAELEDKLIEKEKISKELKVVEAKKAKEHDTIKTAVEKLTGERDYLKGENEKLRGKFTQDNLSDFNIHKTLFKMDPHKYGQAITDYAPSADNIPIWANLDFLDRGQEQLDPNNPKALKYEISKIKHENKDFAAELEKAQNLLLLQRDIERDNTQYYQAELQRLELLSKSAAMKAEELARRADEKARQIQEINKKFGLSMSRGGSPLKTFQNSQANLDHLETQSEFSVMTNESQLKMDENILDFVVQDAEYYQDSFGQVLDARELQLHSRTLITFVTVDFYNHDTETSQIAEGYKPLYNTQFSFKNKVDDFYVQFLQKQTLKLDFYISKNNAAIHIGHAELSLREIVEREIAVADATSKTPIVQKVITIYPLGGRTNSTQPLGTIRCKIRMRQAISEAMRFYRERNEMKNIANQSAFPDSDMRSRRKMITIQIVGARDLKVKYQNITPIAPFFYYQFYTFDERYSTTSQSAEPNFNDSQAYEVNFDGKFINYIQKEPLEVILFDDNAPITGVERGGKALNDAEQNEDMIGTAKIPLTDLVKGGSVYDRFPIRNTKKEKCGELEVKVTIIDLDQAFDMTSTKKTSQQNLPYNKQWENEIIFKIAQKLCSFPADVDMIFGVFSRGQKTVTKEDFKYCVLQRLNLRSDISERELDMFLRSCSYLVDKEYIDRNDFVIIFSSAITQARHEQQNEEAVQQTTIRKFEEMQRSLQNQQQSINQQRQSNAFDEFSRTHDPIKTFNASPSKLSFHEQEVFDILVKCRTYGNIEALKDKIRLYQNDDFIDSKALLTLLNKDGGISETESRKIVQFLEYNNRVQVSKFLDILSKSHSYSTMKSQALIKFNNLIKNNGEKVAYKLLELDHNKDGQLILDGLVACLTTQGFGFTDIEEIHEVFQIVQKGGEFAYKDYLLEINPNLKMLLSKVNNRSQPNVQTRNTQPLGTIKETRSQFKDDSISESHSFSMTSIPTEDPKLKLVRQKFKNYVSQQKLTLASLFKLMDTDSDKMLDLNEFIQKMRLLDVNLDEDEMKVLFRLLDKSGDGKITYKEFAQEFPEINNQHLIKRILNIIGTTPISYSFEQYSTDKQKAKMSYTDFKRFVKDNHPQAEEHEIDSFFRHFDQQQKGFITLEEFKDAFGREAKEQSFKINIEDIIKPLATKVAKFNVNVSALFDKYDLNKNRRLSAEELSKALLNDFKIALSDDEVQTIKEYFIYKKQSPEIKEIDFIDLLQTKFTNKYDENKAIESLKTLKQKLTTTGATPQSILMSFDLERIGKLTLRNFKVAINQLNALNQTQIDNLARYLDKENDGFIGIKEFDVAVKGVFLPHSKTQSFTSSGKFTQKWSSNK